MYLPVRCPCWVHHNCSTFYWHGIYLLLCAVQLCAVTSTVLVWMRMPFLVTKSRRNLANRCSTSAGKATRGKEGWPRLLAMEARNGPEMPSVVNVGEDWRVSISVQRICTLLLFMFWWEWRGRGGRGGGSGGNGIRKERRGDGRERAKRGGGGGGI